MKVTPRCSESRCLRAKRASTPSRSAAESSISLKLTIVKSLIPAPFTDSSCLRSKCRSAPSPHEERRKGADDEEARRKAFLCGARSRPASRRDVRVEGTARVAADREHVHHVLLLSSSPLTERRGWLGQVVSG